MAVGALAQTATVLEKDGYRIPVSDFSGIEPYLHTTSDTTFVIDLWATWCIPCVQGLPSLLKLDSAYSGKKVKVILVNIDKKSTAAETLIPFLKKRNIKTKVLLMSDMDQDSWIPKIDPSWDGSIPITIIFNKDKRKFYAYDLTYPELTGELEKF